MEYGKENWKKGVWKREQVKEVIERGIGETKRWKGNREKGIVKVNREKEQRIRKTDTDNHSPLTNSGRFHKQKDNLMYM